MNFSLSVNMSGFCSDSHICEYDTSIKIYPKDRKLLVLSGNKPAITSLTWSDPLTSRAFKHRDLHCKLYNILCERGLATLQLESALGIQITFCCVDVIVMQRSISIILITKYILIYLHLSLVHTMKVMRIGSELICVVCVHTECALTAIRIECTFSQSTSIGGLKPV